MFFGSDEDDDLTLIDWQVSGLAIGLYDVAYFLVNSISTEVRREIEREVLEEYTAIVRDMGARDFTFEACWRLYRHSALALLVVSVFVCGGLDLDDERSSRLAEFGLQRTLAAIEDLDAADLLRPPPAVS